MKIIYYYKHYNIFISSFTAYETIDPKKFFSFSKLKNSRFIFIRNIITIIPLPIVELIKTININIKMPIRVYLIQEDKYIEVNENEITVEELLNKLKIKNVEKIYINRIPVDDFNTKIFSGSDVIIIKKSIPGRCKFCNREAYVRIPY
ncbi:MAG: hypothetical protein ACP5G1_04670, partial [Nanopusillaceae archaeon]